MQKSATFLQPSSDRGVKPGKEFGERAREGGDAASFASHRKEARKKAGTPRDKFYG